MSLLDQPIEVISQQVSQLCTECIGMIDAATANINACYMQQNLTDAVQDLENTASNWYNYAGVNNFSQLQSIKKGEWYPKWIDKNNITAQEELKAKARLAQQKIQEARKETYKLKNGKDGKDDLIKAIQKGNAVIDQIRTKVGGLSEIKITVVFEDNGVIYSVEVPLSEIMGAAYLDTKSFKGNLGSPYTVRLNSAKLANIAKKQSGANFSNATILEDLQRDKDTGLYLNQNSIFLNETSSLDGKSKKQPGFIQESMVRAAYTNSGYQYQTDTVAGMAVGDVVIMNKDKTSILKSYQVKATIGVKDDGQLTYGGNPTLFDAQQTINMLQSLKSTFLKSSSLSFENLRSNINTENFDQSLTQSIEKAEKKVIKKGFG